MVSKNIKGLFFDLDGTLINSIGVLKSTYYDFLSGYAVDGSEQEFQKMNGPSIKEVVQILQRTHGLPGDIHEMTETYLATLARIYSTQLEFPAKTIESLLHFKAKGFILYLVTSTPRNMIEIFLKEKGVYDIFKDYVFGNEVTHSKPNPEIYLKAIEKSGMNLDEILVIEDSLNGINAAKAAGLSVCAIIGTHDQAFLDNTEADFVINSIEDIFLINE